MPEKLRKCTVDGRAMIFHCWRDEARVIEPSPMIGGHPGGTIQFCYGIVEDAETGEVQKVLPEKVVFEKADLVEARYGEWVYTGGRPIHCNQCGYAPENILTTDNSLFCPHCGADMKKRGTNG